MKKMFNISLTAIGAIALVSCGESFDTKGAPKTSEDSFSYAVGLSVGRSMKKQGLDGLSYGAFVRGVRDALSKDSGYAISEDKLDAVQRSYVNSVQAKKMKSIQEATKKQLSDIGKQAGVTQLPSKAYYKQIKAGNGVSPQSFDTVICHYKMKNTKGKVLVDNFTQPQPFKAPLYMLNLLPIEEAFQKTAEGGKFEVYISNELAPALSQSVDSFEEMYGITSFEVELIKVIPGKAPKAPMTVPAAPATK